MRAALAISLALGFGLTGSPASATCVGSDAFSTCFDSSGNSYSASASAIQTFMNGSNAVTGSNWSEHAMTMGNTTYLNGQASDGGSWNETEQHIGNMEVNRVYGQPGKQLQSHVRTMGRSPHDADSFVPFPKTPAGPRPPKPSRLVLGGDPCSNSR